MRTAVLVLSLVGAAVAEAPYQLPRPGPNGPGFNYHRPATSQQYQQNYVQNGGYQYQQPNFGGQGFAQPQPLPGYLPPQFQVNSQQQYVQQPNVVYGSPLLRQAPVAAPLPLPIAPQSSGFINQYQQGYTGQAGYQGSQGGYLGSQGGYQGVQAIGQSPLAYNSQSSSYSSYQADTNAYGANQIHREPLDSVTVNRIQNILKENEHTSARNAGYISLVSGVALEGARPSVELSSFVHNTPLRNQGSSLQDLARGRALQPAPGYGLPSISANGGSQGQTGVNFLPHSQPSGSYGTPN